jgi:hypothetical protein
VRAVADDVNGRFVNRADLHTRHLSVVDEDDSLERINYSLGNVVDMADLERRL